MTSSSEMQNMIARITTLWYEWLQQEHALPTSVNRTTNATNTMSLHNQNQAFLNEVQSYSERVLKYEDKELLDRALEHIPIHQLYDEATAGLEDDLTIALDGKVILRLMHWFKHDFFTWVNNPPCDYCGSSETESRGTAKPSEEDERYGARIVELYQCDVCSKMTRFPRYNDPGKLLETRRGRCGEWANCFTLCCRAIGSEVRLVYDKTDHVWTEVYSEAKERWIHCDSGEEAYDQPLLYSEGWGKKLNYCIAFSSEEALDVTKRYTRHWTDVLKRRVLVDEKALKNFLDNITTERQMGVSEERRTILKERRKRENKELEDASKRQVVRDSEKVGRQTGSIEWRTARGESGHLVQSLLAKRKDVHALNTQEMQWIGSATPLRNETQDDIIRLTSTNPDQLGGVYCKEQLDLVQAKAVVVEFSFRITNKQGEAAWDGADGFAFVIQSMGPTAIGQGGCEMGYGGLRNSVAIEFDTYQSSDRCDDPSGNHISLHTSTPPQPNSAHQRQSLGHTSKIPPMNSGAWIHVRISMFSSQDDDDKKMIDVSLKEKQDDAYTSVLVLDRVNLDRHLDGHTKAWIGFTASTGGLAQNHDIQWKRVDVYRQ